MDNGFWHLLLSTRPNDRSRTPASIVWNRSGSVLAWMSPSVILFSLVVLLFRPTSASGQQVDEDFFESKVRPVLLAKCVSCHGSTNQEADVRLDSRAAILKGGSSGAIVDLETADHSSLLNVIAYDGDIQMPPDGKLPDEEIAALQAWVNSGLPWPDSVTMGDPMDARIAASKAGHWSFQPITKPNIPTLDASNTSQATVIDSTQGPVNPIDAIVFTKLKEKGLSPSLKADNKTLVRRLYFDLLGLPATEKDLQEFQQHDAQDRWPALVDDLLARPQFGERWARHWLDVARYADTQGYAFESDRRYPHAYTYRDFVVNAFNQDLPYDQFILQQLAADQIDLGDDLRPLAGLGFVTVGRRFIDYHDTLDDRIDVVTRGLLGLTVSCARCHDHKYDAIPTTDYYSLYGVFANSVEPGVKPPIGDRGAVETRKVFDQKKAQLQGELDTFRSKRVEQEKEFTKQRLHDYFYALVDPNLGVDLSKTEQRVGIGVNDLRPRMIKRWQDRFNEYAKDRSEYTAIFRPFAKLMALPDDQFAEAAKLQIATWDLILNPKHDSDPVAPESETEANSSDDTPPNDASIPVTFKVNRTRMLPWIIDRLKTADLQSKQDVATFYADMVRETWKKFADNGSTDKAVLLFDKSMRIIIELYRTDPPLNFPPEEIGLYLPDADYSELQGLEKTVSDFQATAPAELPLAMALEDRGNIEQPFVFIRGSAGNRGPDVPRRYLAVLSSGERNSYPDNASGRLQLAQQIVAPENPLTARVIANRVWMHHFGAPLVDTPSDFGIRCEQPVQHELLDFLAWYLRENQWSLKSLHRLILTSETFQQASIDRPDARTIDPENRLLWKMNRRRMEWEVLRDSMLAVTGQLDLAVGGKSIDMFRQQSSNRRSIYGIIDRQDLPNLLRSFDFASPDSSAARRPQTTVPQQSLFLMNGAMLQGLSEKMLDQAQWNVLQDRTQKIAWLFDRIYLRMPTDQELQMCQTFLNQAISETQSPSDGDDEAQQLQKSQAQRQQWQSLIQAILMSNEFCFID